MAKFIIMLVPKPFQGWPLGYPTHQGTEFEKGGGPNRKQGHTHCPPGSDPGNGVVDN
jgi:hypothetical protein